MLKSRISMLTDRIDSLVRLPYSVLLTMYAVGILICGIGYLLLYLYLPEQGPTIPAGPIWESAANALYFSLVTALSIGYGDIVPQGLSKVLSMAEALGALFVFGILISKPISHRQEVALSQVHSLTFNDVFTNTREELFVFAGTWKRWASTPARTA